MRLDGLLGDYTTKWIKERAGLRPRTVELYERLLRIHIAPHLGKAAIGDITTGMVRDGGPSSSTRVSRPR